MTPPLRVLHLCSDFAKQRIYAQLVAQLDALGVSQHVYVPVRSAAEISVNRSVELQRVSYRYAHVLRPWHRVFFRTKIRRIVNDLLCNDDPVSATAVHAHFLFSDGAVALELSRRCNVPYLVAVRNTDVNTFMRLRPDLMGSCWRIVAAARKVIFITPAYLELMLQRAPRGVRGVLERKARIVPNGVAEFWVENAGGARVECADRLRLLYVGDFSRNKNLAGTIRAAALVNAHRPVSLTLVGDGGDGEREAEAMLASGLYPFVRRVARVQDAQTLAGIYRAHDIFVMPSFRETFGVAYLEALSQGVPVVFTRAQGIDGYFPPGTVGEPAEARDPRSVCAAVLALAERLPDVRAACVERAREFSWPRIAEAYLELYGEVSMSSGEEAKVK